MERGVVMKSCSRRGICVSLILLSVVLTGCVVPGLTPRGKPLAREEVRGLIGLRWEVPNREAVDARVRRLTEIKPTAPWNLLAVYAKFFTGEGACEVDMGPAKGHVTHDKGPTLMSGKGALKVLPGTARSERVRYLRSNGEKRKLYDLGRRFDWGLLGGAWLYIRLDGNTYTWPEGHWFSSYVLRGVSWPVLWSHSRGLYPRAPEGQRPTFPGMKPEHDPSRSQYDFTESHRFLLGLFGWGHHNYSRYVQVLWIPIPTGEKTK